MRGWQSIRAFTRSSFPKERAGSICKRDGGDSFAAMRWLGKILPTPVKLTKLGASPQHNSMLALSPGSGDGLKARLDTVAISFVIGFKERSTTAGCPRAG